MKCEKNSDEEQQLKKPLDYINGDVNMKDPKLKAITSSIKDEDLDLNFSHIKSFEHLTSTTSASNLIQKTSDSFNGIGLSVIEQFQLNHNMQVSSDNIELAKDIENLNNLESQVFETANINNITQQKSLLKVSVASNSNNKTINNNINNKIEAFKQTPYEQANTHNVAPHKVVPAQCPVVLKQGPVKIIKITTPVTSSGIPKLVSDSNNKNKIIQLTKINPNKIIVLKSNPIVSQTKSIVNNVNALDDNQQTNNTGIVPTVSYESWLDHVIEVLNDSITVQDSSNSIRNTFHVPEAIFNHFNKSFTLNNKRRLPNTTIVIKSGKYKNHIKYIWYFNQASTVQKIFSTKNVSFSTNFSFINSHVLSFVLHSSCSLKSN